MTKVILHFTGHCIKSALMAEAQKLVEVVAHAGEIPDESHFGIIEPWNNVGI